jgi:multicomponent Na+:H+ antiporter subunit G
MMETLFQLLAIAAIIIGTFFSAVGVLGYIRLPDICTRLHATGKVGTLGVALLVVAVALLLPDSLGRSGLLLALLLITGPVAAHAIASAAYRAGVPLRRAIRDDLQTYNRQTKRAQPEEALDGDPVHG